jgi:dethiobiotin synthetase
MKKIAIVGIHTGIGKTITSAVLTEALQADYWKPIQAGELDNSDTITIKNLISNTKSVLHPEAYQLGLAMSPHTAAEKENKHITLSSIVLPQTDNLLLIETAGGLHSPINHQQTVLDLILHLKTSVILVSKNYLGSINH